jgi:hypothetical protein
MGGIGITISSKEEGKAAVSTPLTSLPPNVVEEITKALGIQTDETKQALLGGKIDLPDNVEVTITRKLTSESLTLKKLGGGAQFELKYKGDVRTIPGTRQGR